MELISIVIPCYNSEKTIGIVVDELVNKLEKIKYLDYEIILVNDSSKDNVLSVIKNIILKNDRIKLINFTKNFGQQAAILAGFKYSKGDFIVCLDDDGQDDPNSIDKLIDKYKEGYDIVFARYPNRNQSILRNIGTFMNNYLSKKMLGKPNDVILSSYMITDSKIAKEIIKYDNTFPYIGGLIFRVTKNVTNVDVYRRNRISGKSNYSFKSLFKLWLNGFTAFSVAPLRFATLIGIIFSFVGALYSLYIIVRKILYNDILLGWSSMISSILIIGGIQMILLGLIGEYIGRIYIVLNKSPQYVIKDMYNF